MRTWAILVAVGFTLFPSRGLTLTRAQVDWSHVLNPVVEWRATVAHPIASGDSFSGIFSRYGIDLSEVSAWYRAARPKADLRKLQIGKTLTLSFVRNTLAALRYPIDDERELLLERGGEQKIEARIERLPVRVRVVGARGTVRDSFYRAAQSAGIPDPVISEMVDLLGWEMDFRSDVHPGDRFRVLYEQRVGLDGRPLRPGRILAADFNGREHKTAAYLYKDENGKTLYVDDKGRSLDRALLRYPLEFTRISSAFSHARFHPILRRRRPHLGVDFAAPSGTPVRAIGPGKIRWAAWKGGLGRHVEVDHGNGFITAYSHLRGIQRGIRRGAQVRQGQVIGWVGQSGLATGAHLHFAIFDKGRYVNPLTIRRPPQIASIDRGKLEIVKAAMSEKLRAIQGPYRVLPSTPPLALSTLTQTRQLGPVVLTI